MDIKKALFKLISFCSANKIEYMVTGTTALSMLGIPSEPHDIDIKVFGLNQEQTAKLKELQFLSGQKEIEYADTCYTFMIDDVKINVIVDKAESIDEFLRKRIIIQALNNINMRRYQISVQQVIFALADKMRLRRGKDNAFMLNLINKLSSL